MTITRERTADPVLRPFATGPVFAVAGAMAAVLLLVNGGYGYFGDELYFLAAGRHLDWGYADQPPGLPLLAHLMDLLAPGSVWALRLPSVLAMVVSVVCTALIARELGGGRRAQVLAAGAFAVSMQFLGSGHYLATSTMDPFLWTVLLWLLTRWLRTRSDDLLLWAGVVTGLALNVKFLVPAFWVVALAFAAWLGPRDLLARPKLWFGAGIALLMAVPTVVWQANNGWPQLEMGEAIGDENPDKLAAALSFPVLALATAGVGVGLVLVLYGLWRLLRTPSLRFLGWTLLVLTVLFAVTGGRFYYVAGLFPLCWAVAAVRLEAGQAQRWWRWMATWPVYALTAVIAVPSTLPVLPASVLDANPGLPRPIFADAERGWPEFTDAVAAVYHSLPPEQRERTAIVTQVYWQASALDHYGPERGLPEPYSGNRGYWTLATPPASADTVLYVGADSPVLRTHFAQVVPVGAVDTKLPSAPMFTQGAPLWLATGPSSPLPELWPAFRDLAL
ncbi:glycosyltransferase family 39 protein [Amycolatopsis sp. 195334CR]|uniref:glycosyltransferase family 39 protein n=1 Tax=Amycolatopsis sp. 195334CR TaxID=2814588 RepID=UPI001A90872C|nr:glycosyltransferase family 39 protein [Amycolatopsis sp. 195334CR]MBN6038573.1 glycosyltransferase family 39 protein [Amycolatopsis sp. 195334CR]